MSVDLDEQLVDAIHHHRLPQVAARIAADSPSGDDRRRAEEALDTCARIAAATDAERSRIAELLMSEGITVEIPGRPAHAQRHEIRFDLRLDDAKRSAEVLRGEGYRTHPVWSGGAERSFWATADEVVLTRSDAWTTVVRLRWRSAAGPFDRLLRPRPADWDAVVLPAWAWRGYSIVRPVRLLLERTRLRRRDHAALEPFLATPDSLIDPLLDVAGVGPADVVADLGCGDGRIVVAAARRGGRAIGVEYSAELAAQARRAAADAGVAERVRIVVGDARRIKLDEVSVVVLFLPIGVAARLLPDLLARLATGTTVVLHEQSPLPPSMPRPTATMPLIGHDAVTVAHLWRVVSSEQGETRPPIGP